MITLCKLVDGSIVIGKLNDEGVTDAVEVYIQNLHDGVKVSLMPIMYPFNQELSGIFIPRNRIMCTTAAQVALKDSYIQAISGIIPASSIPQAVKNGMHIVK